MATMDRMKLDEFQNPSLSSEFSVQNGSETLNRRKRSETITLLKKAAAHKSSFGRKVGRKIGFGSQERRPGTAKARKNGGQKKT